MKKVNGNIWTMSSCNRLVAERIEGKRHEKHLRALESTRGMVDSAEPQQHPHLRSKPKTRKLQEDRAAEIQLENRILLQKMLNIDTKPSELGAQMVGGQMQARSLHGGAQRKELDRITAANQDLLKRLQGAKASIDPRQWEDEEVDRQALKYRLSQNSCRGRAANLALPPRITEGKLPRIGGSLNGRFNEDEWAELTNNELDKKLRDMEAKPALE